MTVRSEHWSSYWQSGCLTSLPQDFKFNYEGELKAHWAIQFENSKKGSYILDLCTGNGAIAILAAEHSEAHDRNFKVTGLDVASISNETIVEHYSGLRSLINEISFIGNTKIEEAELPAESFSLICSQYGIEYCDWESVAKAVFNWLERDGTFSMVCHGHDTTIMKTMIEDEKSYKKLSLSGFFGALEKFLNGSINSENLILNINRAFSELASDIEARQSELIANIANTILPISQMTHDDVESNKGMLTSFYQQHLFAYQRLKDVVGVSSKISENPNWYLVFEQVGLKLVEKGVIMQNGKENAGYFYNFIKQTNHE